MARDTTICPVCTETIAWPEESCATCEDGAATEQERARMETLQRRNQARHIRAYGAMVHAMFHYRTIWDRLYSGRALKLTGQEQADNAARLLNRCSQVTKMVYRLARVN